MGCDFAMKSCKELMEKDEKMRKAVSLEAFNILKNPFCSTIQDGQGMTLCNHDRSSVGSCNLVKYEQSLPKIYQNFAYVENVKRRDIRKVSKFAYRNCNRRAYLQVEEKINLGIFHRIVLGW